MDIQNQFNFIANEYDSTRKYFIPCFDDFYEKTTDFIASNIDKPKRIIDLGAGTGLLSYFWYQHFPDSEYILADIAEEMLNVAQKRFSGIDNFSYRILNYAESLPSDTFDAVISALSIHHLENDEKALLFSKIYDRLSDGGLFVNYDQFCAGDPLLNEWYDSFWHNRLINSPLSENDIELWKERRKLDKECSVEQETNMLKQSGFKIVKCVYSNLKFSVIVAIKQPEKNSAFQAE